jgi:hypothetical protein
MFHPDPDLVAAGLQVMAYGLAGVFTALILFYAATKAMLKIAWKLQSQKKDE